MLLIQVELMDWEAFFKFHTECDECVLCPRSFAQGEEEEGRNLSVVGRHDPNLGSAIFGVTLFSYVIINDE